METKKKIIFFIVTTLLLGTITFLIIRNMMSKQEEDEEPVEDATTTEAVVEDIDYEKYMELRSEAHENETFAILIWNSSESDSIDMLNEVKLAFTNRKSVVYLLDEKNLTKEDRSNLIDDITSVMEYSEPSMIVPTFIIMSKGEIIGKHAGFIHYEVIIDQYLNPKSVE